MKIKITSAYVMAGNVYEFLGEDGYYTTSSYQVGVVTVDGRKLFHSEFLAKGHGVDEEGFNCVNYNAKNKAQQFADKVAAVGVISDSRWSVIQEQPSLEERLNDEVLREYRDGERW